MRMSLKKIIVFSICAVALCFNLISQENERFTNESNDEWAKIFDYLAAEFTYEYIQELEINNQLNAEEKDNFDQFREKLANNDIERPIAPDSLKSYMNGSFQVTYKRLTKKVYALNNLDQKSVEHVFIKIDSILKEIKSDIRNTPVYEEIRAKVNSQIESFKFDNSRRELASINKGEIEEGSGQGNDVGNVLFIILSGILFFSSILLLFAWLHTRKELRKLKKDQEENSLAKNNHTKQWSYNNTTKKSEPRLSTESRGNCPKLDDSNSKNAHKATPSIEKKVPEEISSKASSTSVNTNKSNQNKPSVLYAGKPTNEGYFLNVDEAQNDNHIYKLKPINDHEVEFNLIELGDYMQTEVINAPDEYLYRVCINENSNQNFSGEIITTKRGIAHKVDGKWKVNEENKATIKFK